jgi:diguanylate cyclase (GGDEF)-like protein
VGILDRVFGGVEGGRALMERSGRIAALFYLGGGAIAIPAILLVAPEQGILYALPLLGLVPGVVCLLLPWKRLPTSALHFPVAAGIVIICVLATAGDLAFSSYYALAAVFVAITFPRGRPILAYMSFAALALFVPVFVGPQSASDALVIAIVTAPVLFLVAGVVGWLTARLEAGRAAYLALSRTDELTGVGNYRALHERLAEETSRHDRRGRSFALIVLDLNDFKQVNERHGHLEGDRVLAQVGRVLREGVRAEDSVFRQGGDEFSILAPETDLQRAEDLADRVRIGLEGIVGVDPPLGACTGTAIFPDDGASGSDLLGYADMRLLAAKHEYRTRPVAYEEGNGETERR